ncbi:MAG: FUSC family protein [Rhodopila sp.]
MAVLRRWLPDGLPAILFGLRLWAAVCLALYLAFWLQLENPSWAGTTAAIVCQPALGASLRKGWFRLIGTVIGAIAAIIITACFPQSRAGFLLGLAFWGGLCALAATLLRNFASYAAALAGYTAATIAGDELGALGGISGDVFALAVARASEISLGIVCAGFVLASTDFGGARRRLAAMLTDLSAEIAAGLIRALRLSGPAEAASATERRKLMVRVAGLEAVIDQTSGEIATLPFRPRVLQAAEEGLFRALFAWRSIANHLQFVPEARADVARVCDCLPLLLASRQPTGELVARWLGPPREMRAAMLSAARRLVALPVQAPSLRLLGDRTAEGLLALARAMTGVLVLDDPWVAKQPRHVAHLRTPDVLPALINGVRAFLTVGAAALIWIGTAWPSGTMFIVFTTVAITLFAPQEDTAYAAARTYTIGAALSAVCAAVVAFALLPRFQSFAGLCAMLGVVLVPAATLSVQPWQPALFGAIGMNFVPLIAPANPMTYDPARFYNTAIAILGGIGFAMLAMRLLPPMPPAMRVRRLLALTLRDLRRLARGRLRVSSARWEGRVFGRLSAMPESVDLLQAARLGSALSVGRQIIRLRLIADRFALCAVLEPALSALAAGDSAAARRALDRFDAALAAVPEARPGVKLRLRARGTTRAMADSLTQHASYFNARV